MHKQVFWKPEDPDQMPHNVVFHQDLHCLLRQNMSSDQELMHIFGNYSL